MHKPNYTRAHKAFEVHIVTVRRDEDLSYGARCLTTTEAYLFADLASAERCEREENHRAAQANLFPGVLVTVTLYEVS